MTLGWGAAHAGAAYNAIFPDARRLLRSARSLETFNIRAGV